MMKRRYLLLIPAVMASAFWVVTTVCVAIFFKRKTDKTESRGYSPFVSVIKPVCGLEKDLYENLSSACKQDYPNYEVIFAVQRSDDPAIETLQRVQQENPQSKAHVVIDESATGTNGKISNMRNALKIAQGQAYVFSDSDMRLEPNYLKTIIAPLAQEQIGIVCTLYKVWRAKDIVESLEALSLNGDFVPSMIFAVVTRASLACTGATTAMRAEVLEQIGGLEPLGDYWVEDYELGRRVVESGRKIQFIPYVVNTGVNLQGVKNWWRHQVYWDHKTLTVSPVGFFFTILIRGIPFALLYALSGGVYRWAILGGVVGLRLITTAVNLSFLDDREVLKRLWLLPLRDILSVGVWFASLTKRQIYWRGKPYRLKNGKMEPLS
jgi:ceramide glucosyltransferase